MPTAPTIVQLSYNWWTDRKSAPITAIVAHNTVGWDSRAYLSRGGEAPDGSDRQVSIHSLIRKDGILYRYVPDERGANHAGFGKMPPSLPPINPNRQTISFELENASDGKSRVDEYTSAQLMTMGWEINRIRAKYGHLPIFRHAEIDAARRKDTVGLSVPQIEEWAARAKIHYALDVPPELHTFIARGIPVYEQSDRTGPLWGFLQSGETVVIDDMRNGHLADNRGFVKLDGGLEAL